MKDEQGLKTLPEHIQLQRLTGPETGWPIASHCDQCHCTFFTWSPYTIKPSDGDFHLFMKLCLNDDAAFKHNLYFQTRFEASHVD